MISPFDRRHAVDLTKHITTTQGQTKDVAVLSDASAERPVPSNKLSVCHRVRLCPSWPMRDVIIYFHLPAAPIVGYHLAAGICFITSNLYMQDLVLGGS